MANSPFYWIFVVILVLFCIGFYWYNRHDTAQQLIDGKIEIDQGDAEGLRLLLDEAGIPPQNVRLFRLAATQPCWHAPWNPVDRFLRVDRRFGQFGEMCVGVDGNRLVSLSLVGHRLKDGALLSRLNNLRTIQLRDGAIARFDSFPDPCRWTILILQQNQLTEINLKACATLEQLDLSFNKLATISHLDTLQYLKRVQLDNNVLTELNVAGNPAIEQLYLTNNRLENVNTIHDLGQLSTLDVAGNQIASLDGLNQLDLLRLLKAGNNPITSIETGILLNLPLLQHVGLTGTAVANLPEGFEYEKSEGTSVRIQYQGNRNLKIDIGGTSLAERLRANADAMHDSKAVVSVEQLPYGRGRAHNAHSKSRSGGFLSQQVDAEGSIDWLDGTHRIGFTALNRSIGVTVDASVERGRLRVYLQNSQGGYYYAEAIPGKPLQVSGALITGTSEYFFYMESVGGRAEEIVWSAK